MLTVILQFDAEKQTDVEVHLALGMRDELQERRVIVTSVLLQPKHPLVSVAVFVRSAKRDTDTYLRSLST